jgi:hypothetical protein
MPEHAMTDPMTTTSAAPAAAETWREIDDLVLSLSSVISVTIDALEVWWPPTFRPAGFGRTRFAWSTTAVDKPCLARHYPRRAPPLAFLAGAASTPAVHLGITTFGQSGDLDSVYRHHGLDADTIVRATLDTVHR